MRKPYRQGHTIAAVGDLETRQTGCVHSTLKKLGGSKARRSSARTSIGATPVASTFAAVCESFSFEEEDGEINVLSASHLWSPLADLRHVLAHPVSVRGSSRLAGILVCSSRYDISSHPRRSCDLELDVLSGKKREVLVLQGRPNLCRFGDCNDAVSAFHLEFRTTATHSVDYWNDD